MKKNKETENLDSFIKNIVQSVKKTDSGIEIILSKNQLINPLLNECIEKGYFLDIQNGAEITFKCFDGDLFFNEEETIHLLENYGAIKDIANSELYFEETINLGCQIGEFKENAIVTINSLRKQVLRKFSEIMEVNGKLSAIAKKINNLEEPLSPFEKYLLCVKIVSNVEDFYVDGPSQSFIETVKNNKGCCVGKSEYLRALLYMVGINACDVKINAEYEEIIVLNEMAQRGDNGILTLNGELFSSPAEAMTFLLRDLDGKYDKNTNHEINLIYLNDDKYNMRGIIAGDVINSGTFPFCEILPLKGNVQFIFNFVSMYESCGDINKLLKGIKLDNRLSEADKKRIEEKYINIARDMISNKIERTALQLLMTKWRKSLGAKYNSYFENCSSLEDYAMALKSCYSQIDPAVLQMMNIECKEYYDELDEFLAELKKCGTFSEMETLFNKKSSSSDTTMGNANICAKDYEEIFEKFKNDEKLLRIRDAIETYISLENAPYVDAISTGVYEKVIGRVNSIYEEKFVQAEKSNSTPNGSSNSIHKDFNDIKEIIKVINELNKRYKLYE